MGTKAVLGEVFGQWSWQTYSPTDAAAAGFSTRVIGKGGHGRQCGPGCHQDRPDASRCWSGRGLGFSPTSPKAAAAELLQPQNYAAGLLSGVTLKMEIPPIWATSPELPFHNLSLRAKMDTSYGSISVSPQAKTWGLGMFPGRVAGAWLLSAGVASDGMPTLSAAGFLGAVPPGALQHPHHRPSAPLRAPAWRSATTPIRTSYQNLHRPAGHALARRPLRCACALNARSINRPEPPRACALLRAGSSAPCRPRCGA
jgi:hypothetical protein